MQLTKITKGAACFQCRKWKMKCDAEKPTCSRCQHRGLGCVYPTGIAKRTSLTALLEARALELEVTIQKLTLSSIHDLSLVSARLLKRVAHLGESVHRLHTPATGTAAWPQIHLRSEGIVNELIDPVQIDEDDAGGLTSVLRQDTPQSYFTSELAVGSEPLPLSPSLYLISLFLPYRTQYYFLMDLPRFLHGVSLPSSHPEAIHPCLLNACYLAACASSRGDLTSFQPYFLHRTRHFLEQSLMYCDRITHFLWASIILGCFFAQERRLEECFAVAGAATRFAFGCGLAVPHTPKARGSNEVDTIPYILPPPEDMGETVDRIRLAHCLYLLDQTLPPLGSYIPSFPYNSQWECIPEAEAPLGDRDRQDSTETGEAVSEPRESRTDFRISMARVLEKVTGFVRSVHEQGDYNVDEEYDGLVAQMSNELLTIPPMSDVPGPTSLENPRVSKSHNIFEHTTPYGTGLILYSLRAGKDLEARRKLFHCVQALVDICRYARVHKNSGKVQIGFANLSHIMNAIRVITQELRQPETSRDPKASLSYCTSIETLLDFVDDVVLLWPAWSNSPAMLKDTLNTTLTLLTSRLSIPRQGDFI